MPDLFDLIVNSWKKIVTVMIVSLLIVGAITFLKPRLYLSVATAVPASSVSSDKARIFNENIQSLYAALGSPDDLDLIIGTAKLDTVYLAVTDSFNLFDHYKISNEENNARTKAALQLKKNCDVMKSEYGELKVKVWDTDQQLAPQLANAIMQKLASMHQAIRNAGNNATLTGLLEGNLLIEKKLAALPPVEAAKKNALELEQQQYEKLITEYQLLIDSKPPVLIMVEQATPSVKPDKPKRLTIMIATAVLSFFFALLAGLFLASTKSKK